MFGILFYEAKILTTDMMKNCQNPKVSTPVYRLFKHVLGV